MDLETLLSLCKKYSDLGWDVQDQLNAVIDGESMEDQNSNALDMAADFLKSAAQANLSEADYYADKIDAYLAE